MPVSFKFKNKSCYCRSKGIPLKKMEKLFGTNYYFPKLSRSKRKNLCNSLKFYQEYYPRKRSRSKSRSKSRSRSRLRSYSRLR